MRNTQKSLNALRVENALKVHPSWIDTRLHTKMEISNASSVEKFSKGKITW